MNIGDILLELARALFALAFEYGGVELWQTLLTWLLGAVG